MNRLHFASPFYLALTALVSTGSIACDVQSGLSAYLGGHKRTSGAVEAHAEPIASAAVAPSSGYAPQVSAVRAISSVAAPASALPSPAPVAVRPKPEATPSAASSSSTINVRPRWTGPSNPVLDAAAPPASSAPPVAEASQPSSPAVLGADRNASVGGAAVSGGNVSNAARVVAGLRKGLRDCYAREPAESAGAGSIRFVVTVGPTGEVSDVRPQPSGSLPGTVVSCATGHVRAAKFAPPEGGKAVIAVPVTFVTAATRARTTL